MPDKYSHRSEKKALQRHLLVLFRQNRRLLCGFYLEFGFEELVKMSGIKDEFQKQLLFDFLMLECRVVLECIVENRDFFLGIIGEGKGEKIRVMLGLTPARYDRLWKQATELLSQCWVRREVDEKLANLKRNFQLRSAVLEEQRGEG